MRPPEVGGLFAERGEPNPERIRRWLKEDGGLEAMADVVNRLAMLSRRVDLRFLTAFLTHQGWFLDPDGRFGNPDWYVTPYAEIGGLIVTALLENRHASESAVLDVYEDRKPVPGVDRLLAQREAAMQQAGYDYRPAKVSQLEAVMDHLEQKLRVIEAHVNPASTRHYGELVAPGLIWKPLGEHFELAGVGATPRRQRLTHWLRDRDYVVQPALLAVLAQCQWDGPVRFLIPFLHPSRGQWKQRHDGLYRGESSLGIQINPTLRHTGLTGREETAQPDFVISRFAQKRAVRTVIDVRQPASYKIPYAESRRRLRQQLVEAMPNHQYLLLEPEQAMQVGREWAEMLTETAVTKA